MHVCMFLYFAYIIVLFSFYFMIHSPVGLV